MTTFLPIFGLCVLVNSKEDHRQDVCRCFWAQVYLSSMGGGWLCSSSVGHGYAISGTGLCQNFLKTGKEKGILQRFISLNISREGRGQGHRLEQGLKNVCVEISVQCFT